MNKKILICLFLIFTVIRMNAAFSGKVFLDKNKNGIYDKGEKTFKNIAVSDGLNVVFTNKKGDFILKGSSVSKFIFITVPAGYRTSKDHYLRIRKDKNSYDFGLLSFPETAKRTRFIQITDTETYEYGDWISDIRDFAANNKVGFIVHTGDICYEKGLKFHAKNINTKTMNVPVFYCIGNHDLVNGAYGEELFESLFGPVYYSFDVGNTHFIVTPMRSGDYKPEYTNTQVYNWLVNDLAHVDPSKNIVVFNHDLLTFDDQFIFRAKGKKDINLNDYNLKAWIYGHWHINFLKQHGENGPVSVCSSTPDKGGIDHSPSNFLVYDVLKNGKINITPRYSSVKKQLVIDAPLGNDVLLNPSGHLKISANTYHTVSKTKQVLAILTHGKSRQKTIPLKQNTDWNWSAEIQLGKKWINEQINLRVESVFENGETIVKNKTFRFLKENNTPGYLEQLWVHNVKGNIWMAPPLEANGIVYIATIDDFSMKNCGIHAVDAVTGSELWYFKTSGSVKNTICYEDGKVLATDHFGISYAIDAVSGKLIWKKELGQKSLGAYNTGNVVKNGIFYSGFGNYLQAVDIKTGETIWINKDWRGGEGNTATMIIADHVLITGSNWRALYAHDIKTGKLLWKKSKDGFSFRSSSATFKNDTLYVASQKGMGMMDLYTGKMYHYFETPYNLQTSGKPLLINNLIVIGTAENGLTSFNKETGEEAWLLKTGQSLFYTAPYSKNAASTVESPPVLLKDHIVFGASDGYLYVADPKDGNVIEKVNLGAPVFSSVTPFLNGFFVADFAGNIYRFKFGGK